jgi:purine-binding chemotaxis protein CheW
MSIASHQPIAEDAVLESAEHQQFLTFSLNDEIYGIGILSIHEIIEYGDLTVVPLMPDFISGVINLRGSVVPVINLARRFGQQPREISKRSSIIIVEFRVGDDSIAEAGIIVDNVDEVVDFGADDIAPVPTFGTRIRTDFIQGMGRINDQLMILLDINHVLAISEISAIAELNGSPGDLPEHSNGQ